MASTHDGTVTLTASARYGYGGKQFVARIEGRDPKYTFERTFLGRKEGKRGEQTSTVVDEPGLYMERDVDSKGRASDRYYVIFANPACDGVDFVEVEHTDAMKLAKLTASGIESEGREREAQRLDAINAAVADRDPDEVVTAKNSYGEDVIAGRTYPSSAIVAARAERIAALRGEVSENASEPIGSNEASMRERDEARTERDAARDAVRLILSMDGANGSPDTYGVNIIRLSPQMREQLEGTLR